MTPQRCPICKSTPLMFITRLKMFRYYRCGWCRSIFTFPKVTQNNLNQFYKHNFSYVDGSINEQIIRTRAQKILTTLIKIKGRFTSLCDVGCGYGYFLDSARPFVNNVYGVEPSSGLAAYSRNYYQLSIFHGTVHDYIQSRHYKQYDVVTSIHVIEHVANPKNHINHLLTLLKPGGILYIETPNADSHLFYAEKQRYTFLLAPEHPWIFSRYAFHYLLPKNVSSIKIRTYSYSEHVMGVLKSFLRRTQIYGKKHPHQQGSEDNKQIRTSSRLTSIRKKIFYFIFDQFLARLSTPLLNIYHKGSILELYINKK